MGPPASARGADGEAILKDWGFAPAEIAALKTAGVVGAAQS
jgi:crotonobetainyl-CoA:carnitine CoA-transferase CaiB-like acyl-CoA transferase